MSVCQQVTTWLPMDRFFNSWLSCKCSLLLLFMLMIQTCPSVVLIKQQFSCFSACPFCGLFLLRMEPAAPNQFTYIQLVQKFVHHSSAYLQTNHDHLRALMSRLRSSTHKTASVCVCHSVNYLHITWYEI